MCPALLPVVPCAAMNKAVKPAAELLLGSPLSFWLISISQRPCSLVLALHNVISEDTRLRGDRSLHLHVGTFCDIIDWLASKFDIVPLDQVFDSKDSSCERPRAAITFDDAYEGAISLAIPELWRRRLPATVFAVSSAEAGQTFWWDALADGLPDGMPDSIREAALTEARGDETAVRAWAHNRGLAFTELDGEYVASSWESIRLASRLPGITIASHTRSHSNLAALGSEEVAEELEGSRRELQRLVPESRPWLAYPYGLSSPMVETAAQSAGYKLAFRVTGGVVRRREELPAPYALPRLNIPAGLSLRGFRIRAAGLRK
jgi:peptidoglycan/xylan/chitin deacetylase (PgdA/CDA1 family)